MTSMLTRVVEICLSLSESLESELWDVKDIGIIERHVMTVTAEDDPLTLMEIGWMSVPTRWLFVSFDLNATSLIIDHTASSSIDFAVVMSARGNGPMPTNWSMMRCELDVSSAG